jgi:cyclic beta-1,2-glucan synthetase
MFLNNGIGFLNSFSSFLSYQYVLAFIAICISFLFFLFIKHRIRRAHFPSQKGKISEGLGPMEWEQHMRELANGHKDVRWMKCNFVLATYNRKAYKKINMVRISISNISSEMIELIPAARWLFDNFQMLYREIKKIKTTGTGYVSLPILKSGEYRGHPRIYVLAKKMVDISGGYLNEDNIVRMIEDYQEVLPLTEKELWALPEIIGHCLLERIIEVAQEIVGVIKNKSRAEAFIMDNLIVNHDYLDISPLLQNLHQDFLGNIVFHSHVLYLLKNMSVEEGAIRRYIHYHFGSHENPFALAEIFIEEGKIESQLESNIRTPIESLREINQIDDEKLCEVLSVLNNILMKDPSDIYPKMDSESRGFYRAIIEKLSYKHKILEESIAEECLNLAKEGNNDLDCSHHVGTYIIGKGFPILKAKISDKRKSAKIQSRQWGKSIAYSFAVLLILLISSYSVIMLLKTSGVAEIYKYILLLAVLLPILMDISLKIVNSILLRIIEVKRMPSLDYSEELPEDAKTFIVMPVLVSSVEQGIEYLDRLHNHYLANKQPNLYFALLVDYVDSPEKHMPEDYEIQESLINQLNKLNKKYPSSNQLFSLFIRYRKWNSSEGCYMGWERKRGKLEEFNSLLNGIAPENTSFYTMLCDKEQLSTFKYVITLDADSSLTRDGASKLVGIIDHPLNRAVIDMKTGKVKEGYVIIQPSVRNHAYEKQRSVFPKIYGGQVGIANYSFVITDIYQDLFRESIFVGKGIYNVKAFHKILHKVIPENSVLSHDLLESCYAKTAFASNVNIIEEFPGSVISFDKREHRWIRGDWQLLPWLFKKDLSILSKWKIFDTMRASLVPISKLIFIFLNVAIFPKVFYMCLPILFFQGCWDLIFLFSNTIIHKVRRPKLALVYSKLIEEIRIIIKRTFLDIAFIPSKAYIACDAIVRTLYRLYASKKRLLMWKSADIVEKLAGDSLRSYFNHMWFTIIPGLSLLALTAGTGLYAKIFYIIIALAWCLSFMLAYSISRPRNVKNKKKVMFEEEMLIDIARKIWRYFIVFTTRDNNWLCPDSYQIANREKVALRTSPTNIGLQFLSILSARDFGFINLSSLLDYAENILYTVVVMPKWKGHLYNWYDITTLEVLNPQYISTVDSGNFYGHLIAFKNGLLEQINTPVFTDTMIAEIENMIILSSTGVKLNKNYRTVGDFLIEMVRVREKLNMEIVGGEDRRIIGELTQRINLIEREIFDFAILDSPFSTMTTLLDLAELGNEYAKGIIDRINGLAVTIDKMFDKAEFGFLYNERRKLFHIGYNTTTQKVDSGCYDLMASEALLTSFLAIAKGSLPIKHWHRLGRPLVLIKGIPALVSWSGTMFEYLMPHLLIKSFEGSVLYDSSKAAVLKQIMHAKHLKIPWGISESQYYRFDMDGNYQYRAFGVPGLRLQPEYGRVCVVAPYATMLALEWTNKEAIKNLSKLKALKAFGDYGFYEAIDFGIPDPVDMNPYCIVKSYMAHHQGMSIVAINNYLKNGIMRSRFHREPIVKAAEILLEEKRQTYFISISRKGYTIDINKRGKYTEDALSARYVNSIAPKIPAVNYISNGNYSLLITSDGDGFSNCKGMMLHRWRADIYADTGNYIYIKDTEENKLWSVAYKPTKTEPDKYRVVFSPHQTEFTRRDGDIGTHTIVSLSPDQNLEIRKITLKNFGNDEKYLEITSYMEVVADSYSAELGHPAFNKLFIESEYLEKGNVFLSGRRMGRSGHGMYVMQTVKSEIAINSIEYENDRMRFIGRNNTLQNPIAVTGSIPLSNNTGFSSDPIMSLRVKTCLKPEQNVSIAFITGTCETKEEALRISDKLSLGYKIDDIIEKFRQQSLMELKYLNITGRQLNAFQNLISPIYYPLGAYRGPVESIRRNWKNQSFLWRFGVSGDNSIMLLRVDSIKEIAIIREVLKAFEYMRINRVNVDLIILSEAKHGYAQELTNLLSEMTSSLKIYDEDKERPSIFVIHSYQMNPAELDLLFTVARIVISADTGIYFRTIKTDLISVVED